MDEVDLLIVGAGTAGMPTAIEAVAAGARVLVVEQSHTVGGTLWVSAAQMSGAGTRLQAERGIADDAAAHLADVLRLSRERCDAALVDKAVGLAGGTIDWLMAHGFDLDPQCPAILHFHEAYPVARTYWGRDGGRSVLRVVRPLFDAAMAEPNARLRLGTEVVELLGGERGGVAGAVLRPAGGGPAERVQARAVVLATGGYGANPAAFSRWTMGLPLYSASLPTATGRGIEMAEALGAEVRGGELFLPTFAGILEAGSERQVTWEHLPVLTPQVRQPWELYLDAEGRRFLREDIESVDARERALLALPGLTFWAVFDEAILSAAPPLLPGWSGEALVRAWAGHPAFVTAADLDGLAAATGMAPALLKASVEAYNGALDRGEPDPLGRLHRPAPVARPPYRAIRMHGIVLKTPAGLAVDEELRVLDGAGRPIANLYALGEAIGGSTLSGNAFVSGMSVTPALSFGRWLGARLGAALAVRETAEAGS